MTLSIRWNDTSRNTPKGKLQDAPAPRTLAQAMADLAARKVR